MAPAALLCPSGTVQSLCQTTASSSKVWQAKRSVSSGSALNRPSADSQIEGASVKSSLPKRVYESRRRIGVRHVVRSGPSRYVFSAAVEGSVAVEEPSTESEVVGSSEEKAPEAAEAVPEQGSAPAASPQRKGGKFRRGNSKPRREDPTVPAEALVPGAVFTGKVTTIQPFGAFVNFGAFTDGLVHISKLSSGYVSNVGDIVSLGQEVQVTVIDVDNTAGRIALSMAEKEEKRTEGSGRQGGEAGGDQSRFQEGSGGRPVNKGKSAGRGNQSNRRDEPKKPPSKLVKGQSVEGVVKNSSRGGVYVTLPEDEEAFLKYSEIPGGENMAPEAGLQPGQKITATVLRIDRGKITLSMKPVVDIKSVNSSINKGAGGAATNPFEIAFRAMDLIPEPVAVAEPPVEEAPIVEEPTPEIAAAAAEIVEETKPEEEVVAEVPAEAAAPETVEEKVEEVVETPTVEAAIPAPVENEVTEAPAVEAAIPAPVEEKLEEETEIPSVEAAAPAPVEEKVEEVTETPAVEAAAPAPFEEKVEEVTEAPDVEAAVPAPVEEKVEEVAETPAVEAAAPAPVEEKAEEVTETPAVEAAAPAPVEEKVEEVTETPAVDAAAPTPVEEKTEEVQAPVAAAPVEEKKGGISAALVKQLREETGAGMMDCKKALAESKGDFEKARDALRKKGLASADKKASRIAAEGLIGSYIHDSRIGVLVEVNCETDFVARGPAFKQLVSDLGMQVVASPQVKYVSVEDIPAEIVSKETEMEMQREDLANKPEAVRSKIVEGRVAKRMNEYVLLEQPYIRDDSILVKDLVKQTVATLGENIKVRRFERYTLGEGLEKKNADFAAEVAAQTAKTAEAAKVEEAPAQAKPAEEAAPAPAVAVSAAAVKQLRDSTGAGMMDCKKALAATNGDLEKAVEYLRKKGLASAEKKASRLASEGLVGSYVHNGVIGVLVEVNCETDFVARSEQFKELVKDIAMQIAACPSVNAVGVEDIPASFVEAERAIELGKEDLANKPEAVRAKIVDGRLNKRLSEMALLEQPFIKDDTKLIKDVVKETVAALGENIQVRRFTRFNLGEGIEKKVVDFAAEVAAQTGQKL